MHLLIVPDSWGAYNYGCFVHLWPSALSSMHWNTHIWKLSRALGSTNSILWYLTCHWVNRRHFALFWLVAKKNNVCLLRLDIFGQIIFLQFFFITHYDLWWKQSYHTPFYWSSNLTFMWKLFDLLFMCRMLYFFVPAGLILQLPSG